MENYKNTYIKLVYCSIILFAFIILTFIIKNYFKPCFIIIFIFFTCKPIYDLLCKCKLFNKNINAVLSILLINLIIFFLMFYTGRIFINKIHNLFINNYSEIIIQLKNITNKLNALFELDLIKFNEFGELYSNVPGSNYIKKGAIYTTNGIFTYFIGNIATYFILIDKYVIVSTIEKLFPANKFFLLKQKLSTINKMLKIELILILSTTLETLLGLIALGINNAVFIAVLCGVLDLIPYIGTIMIFMPLIIYNFAIKNNIIAIGLIILYIFLQVTRQITETKFVSKKLELHPLVLILGIYVGIKIFGVIGLFMAPIYIITTKEILFST
ncbi:AI-2E family transporter [Clostridium aestuarii]|uniref:AI-2E family transporter n=1 Tax=Clostridium aestuarii TaxID=338193 RepID=A0ABT4CY88_9CLOT|nr:AI-2E family transporter [Clostridium aestuarii]MCY6483939.1 AI-2E family transporter [Clostridium aestuarii]